MMDRQEARLRRGPFVIRDAGLGTYITDKDPEKAKRAMQAMLKMKKIDIAALEKAHAG